MSHAGIPYEQLPDPVEDNLTDAQWQEAQRGVILEGQDIPETTIYRRRSTST